jgi:hypothetical protein
MNRLALISWCLVLSMQGFKSVAAEAERSPREVFEQRIMPIFKSPNPSSCTECHLAGVDLKNYILPSHEKTFVSLRDQGLIDLENPADSKILRLIAMGGGTNQGAALISAKVREAELSAFSDWIKASSKDPALRNAPKLAVDEIAKPSRPNEVIRHARMDRVLVSFQENVWSQRFRCTGCHSAAGAENKKLVAEHGDDVTWMKESAEATLKHLAGTDNVNVEKPERSRLLLKPLNEVKHAGGQKMLPGDMTYKAFRTFLEDYANTIKDRYATAASLPKSKTADATFGTEIWFKITETPPEWAEKLLQVNVHAWDARKNSWEAEPIATSDRGVWGKGKLWQHSLVLNAPKESERAKRWSASKPSLPAGRYLVKVYVDTTERLKWDWQSALAESEFVGETILETNWPSGYGRMTAIPAKELSRRAVQ